MSLYDVMGKLSEQAQGAVVGLWERWEAEDIAEAEFRTLAGAALTRYGAKGTALADAALAASLTALVGSMMVTTGALEDPTEGAAAAVDDTLGSEAFQRDPANAVAVMGSAFALASLQESFGRGMKDQGVELWVRAPNPGACDMCMDLADVYLPVTVEMFHHKGCGCIQKPVQMKGD